MDHLKNVVVARLAAYVESILTLGDSTWTSGLDLWFPSSPPSTARFCSCLLVSESPATFRRSWMANTSTTQNQTVGISSKNLSTLLLRRGKMDIIMQCGKGTYGVFLCGFCSDGWDFNSTNQFSFFVFIDSNRSTSSSTILLFHSSSLFKLSLHTQLYHYTTYSC